MRTILFQYLLSDRWLVKLKMNFYRKPDENRTRDSANQIAVWIYKATHIFFFFVSCLSFYIQKLVLQPKVWNPSKFMIICHATCAH